MKNNEQLAVNTLRALSIDQIDAANSGHPGLPLGAAPMAWALFSDALQFMPKDRHWINRDRFILSAGHGSALLYSLYYVFGLGIEADDLRSFRQLDSKTPGHPEYGHTDWVETTTGPLGAGIATAVGFAMAETRLAADYNKEGLDLIDHYTYVLCGDGDLMEGISNEASSIAGTLELSKLIVLYDSNNITIEGDTALSFKESIADRYKALGWQVLSVKDGTDVAAIQAAVKEAKEETTKPTIIEINTTIGYGSPKAGTAGVHGSPLGEEGNASTKETLGYDVAPFEIAEEVQHLVDDIVAEKQKNYDDWKQLEEEYKTTYPDAYRALMASYCVREQDLSFMDSDEFWAPVEKDMATRASSHVFLQRVAKGCGNLFGGSADLAPSNKSDISDGGSYSVKDRSGANINFGVREHAMGAIVNGIFLHGGFRSYGATFLVFSDYMKPQLRLSALMGLPVSYIFTHDSIGVGEDGPTHQPIEHLTMLRSIPNMITYRPADSTEVAAAWYVAMHSKHTPVSLILTRQTVPELENSSKAALKGGYILSEETGELALIIMASGSEVHLALKAKEALEKEGLGVRVVSMPSQEIFDAQDATYKASVLPDAIRQRVSIEAASSMSWYKYIGIDGLSIGIDSFGASGNAEAVFEKFGLTEGKVIETIKAYIADKAL